MRFSIPSRAAIGACLVACATVAQPHAAAAPAPAATRDGQHDFDFNLGKWQTHIRRLAHPLIGDSTTVAMSGTVTVRPIWGGRAQLEEIEADGPNGHWQGATLFLYDPGAHQWGQTYYASTHPLPASTLVGSFGGDRGELYAQDTINGRTVLVRGTWSEIKPDSHRYQEAISADGGRSWETVFDAHLERISR
jgi:hypothetical protein